MMYKDIKVELQTGNFKSFTNKTMRFDIAGTQLESGDTSQGGAVAEIEPTEHIQSTHEEATEATSSQERDLEDYQLARDRPKRQSKRLVRFMETIDI